MNPAGLIPQRESSAVRQYVWVVSAAFGTYFCMYGFRKPFVAAAFDDLTVHGMGYKELAVTVQVLGYMLSKFIGIKVISEIDPKDRIRTAGVLVGLAQLALLLFALVPPPWNLVCLFLNGLPLGLIFGLVLGFLEGRATTEALTAGLCASFILADGVVKSVGAWLLSRGIPEFWMPFLAGCLFVLPLALFLGMLSRVPPPTPRDCVLRSPREPMRGKDRREFLRKYGFGLSALVLSFLMITILRSIRADFQPEIWRGMGMTVQPSVYAVSEFWVALGVTVLNGCCTWIVDNRRALVISLGLSLFGLLLIPTALLALQAGGLSPFGFMVFMGLGLYLPYVAFHTTVFERFIATSRSTANLGFLMYVADAVGYLGYVAVMLTRRSVPAPSDFDAFFRGISWVVAGIALLGLGLAWAKLPRPTRP